MAQRDKVVVFDFDGTVSLGSGPVLRYAHHVATVLAPEDGETLLETVAAVLAGEPAPAGPPIDGYDLVRQLASAYNVGDDVLGVAYGRSRLELATEHARVEVAPGLPLFLDSLKPFARIVLATNAPSTRLNEALTALGVSGLFDAVFTNVGKPGGFDAVLDELTIDVPAANQHPWRTLLSVGDVWQNDLEPAARRGFSTALVGPRWLDGGLVSPSFRAERIETLFPEIFDWATDARPEPQTHHNRLTDHPRSTLLNHTLQENQ